MQSAAIVTDIPVTSNREGDVAGLHVLTATSISDRIVLQHESFSRRAFAEGAVRAAEWLVSNKPGCYDFLDVYTRF